MSSRDRCHALLGRAALGIPLALSTGACAAGVGAAERVATRPGMLAPAVRPRALPELDHEPLLRVLVARGTRLSIELEAPTRLTVAGAGRTLPAGNLDLAAGPAGWSLAGEASASREDGLLAAEGGGHFVLEATPLFGPSRRLRLAGDLVLHPAAGELEVVERVPMETYLASVVGAEMNAKWPVAALAAQAIAARSYAAARWMERQAEPWDLHWHYGVDMAYHGWSPGDATVARAIASTRGEILTFHGLPVLALFHASSGGRTESFARVKPGVLAPDGRTSVAEAMPVVDDPAALPGAAGLGLSATHGSWEIELPLSEVGASLAAWSRAGPDRPIFGSVEGISIAGRTPDSGRVESVSIRHRLDGETRFTRLGAADFRLAVGPGRIRSLLWVRCVTRPGETPGLAVAGRGFGHGCGLSQVSAWYLASRGESPEAIVARFYAGAVLERRY